MRITKIVGACVPLLLLVGCSGGDGQAVAPPAVKPASASTSTSTDAVAARFVAGVARADLDGMRELVALTSPNSPARAYVDYLTAFVEAETALGKPPATGTFHRDDGPGMLTACRRMAGDPRPCTVCSKIAYDVEGRLSAFDVDGQPVRTVIARGGPAQQVRGATAQVLGAYRDALNGTVTVVYKVTNGTALTLSVAYPSAELVSGETRHVSTGGLGPDTVPAGADVIFLSRFDAQDPTGTFQVEVDDANGGSPLGDAALTLVPVP
ncbi:hypothetical protein [Parafrankia sp. FMc2]|uniref:hypothetical protein n=1 Tax=Parafrankia sp. FMc2 TaxID=3233196 RepID=UPI0034D47653